MHGVLSISQSFHPHVRMQDMNEQHLSQPALTFKAPYNNIRVIDSGVFEGLEQGSLLATLELRRGIIARIQNKCNESIPCGTCL